MPEKTSYAAGTPSWVDLSTPDVKQAGKFYQAIFGWKLEEVPDPQAGGYAFFKIGDKQVAGGAPIQQPGQPPAWTTYVSVDDADKTVEIAKGAGGTTLMEPMDVMDVGRMAIFADPTGAVIAVWQAGKHAGADLINEPNAFCWTELMSRDVAKAKEFYPTVFGWGTHASGEGMGGYTEFKVGDESVAGLMDMPSDVPTQVPSYWLPYFEVTDPDKTVQQAEKAGGTIRVPATDIPPGRFAIIADPFGATFGVIKLTRQS